MKYAGEGAFVSDEEKKCGVCVYDAAGNRIAKGSITSMSCDITSNHFHQIAGYVVGAGGEQLTEVGADNTIWNHTNVYAGGKLIGTYDSQGLHFHIDDPVGTRRVQVSSSGVLEAVYQSLPFGDGYNAIPLAGSDDPTENHFTGKERDTESGNDYMFARYYNSATGRFLSPDWSAKEEPVPYAKLEVPQSLNLYAYVGNNPVMGLDPSGHEARTLAEDVGITMYNTWRAASDVFYQFALAAHYDQENLRLFPTDVKVDPGSVTVDWRLRRSDGDHRPNHNYLVFEHLSHCGASGTVCQPNGTAIGPAPWGASQPAYADNDPNVFRDGYSGWQGGNTIQSFTIQRMKGSKDLTYDPSRQTPVDIEYGNGTVWGSQGIYHGPGGKATVYVNGYTNIPSVPLLSGEQ